MSEDVLPGLIDSKGNVVRHKFIHSNNVIPLLSNGYNLHNLNQEDKLIPPLGFQKILAAPVSTVGNLNVHPGEPWFLFWFVVSLFLPLISTCLGPLGNMISIIGLADSWRLNKHTGEIVADPTGIRVLNSLSLAFGLIGNTSLVVNFTSTKRYLISQTISISCWIIASMLLLIGIILLNRFHMHSGYMRSLGHWFSVFTIVSYMACTVTMSLNTFGFVIGKYPPMLNLNKKEKALMRYTVCFCVWLVIGACVTRRLVDIEYGAALYYCVVSVLTIGLGDILPTHSGAKAFILVFALVGVVLMGLIVAMIRQVLHKTNNPVVLWHRMEVERRKCLEIIDKNDVQLHHDDAFNIMRRIDSKSRLEQETASLLLTLLTFCVFWLVGAAVFHVVEHWLYFDSIYFCLLCLITIGYGDFAPVKPLGRVFFVLWAIAAVPLMTILISNLGDMLFDAKSMRQLLKQALFRGSDLFITSKRIHSELHHDLTSIESINQELGSEVLHASPRSLVVEDSASAGGETFSHRNQRVKSDLVSILEFVNQLKPLIEDSLDTPTMHYKHDEWANLLLSLKAQDSDPNPRYWLSDQSPLRLPLQEPNYFITQIFYKIESDLIRLIKESDQQLEPVKTRKSE